MHWKFHDYMKTIKKHKLYVFQSQLRSDAAGQSEQSVFSVPKIACFLSVCGAEARRVEVDQCVSYLT